MGFKDEADLDAVIKTTDAAIKRARNKELGIEEEEKVRPLEATFPLVYVFLLSTLQKNGRWTLTNSCRIFCCV